MKTLAAHLLMTLLFTAAARLAPAGTNDARSKTDPGPPAAADFQRAEQESLKRKLTFERLHREQNRVKDHLATAEKDLLLVRSKLTASREPQGGRTPSPSETAAWEAAVKAAESELARLETALQEVAERVHAHARGWGAGPSTVITPGDTLHVRSAEPSINGLYQVRQGGYVIMPRTGRVYVVGKQVTQAEALIAGALAGQNFAPGEVSIDLTCVVPGEEPGHVYLVGEFNRPGPLEIPADNPTLVTAVAKSGGLTADADPTRVKLLRRDNGKELVEEVNVQAMLGGNGLASDLVIKAGDLIVVPSFAPVAYVTGKVATNGSVRLSAHEELSAYSAIVRSGGTTQEADLEKVYVLREHRNGQRTRIPVNLKEVQAGKTPDVILQRGDMVVVPDTKESTSPKLKLPFRR
ncbi:MAG: SLBB domain-containing protein [Verrucomicrobiota bacterium]